MLEDAESVEFRDAQVRDGGDGAQGSVLREFLLNLACLPCGRCGAKDEVQLALPGLWNRDGGFDGLDCAENRRERVEDGERRLLQFAPRRIS